jgi:hypothetical protein
MRNYAAQQERDPSNRIVAPRVEHFNTESNPIQVDSDSDDESTCSFHTAPSSPREEDNNNHELELELEIAKLAENVERNNRTIGDIRAEIVDLEKQKSDLNLEILESKVRSSISTRKRTAQREIPKTTQAPINQSNLANFTNTGSNKQVPPVPPQIGINKSLADTTKNKGKERAHSLQPSPLRHHIPIESHSHTRPKQSVSPVATPQRVIVQPTLQKQRNNTNSTNSTNSTILAQNNMENAKVIDFFRLMKLQLL